MDAIDTQDIIDFLTKGEKAERLEDYLRKVERKKGKVFISLYTLIELAYLLEYSYGVDRERVAKSLRTILEDRVFRVEGKTELEKAINLYSQGVDLFEALKEVQYEKAGVKRLKL